MGHVTFGHITGKDRIFADNISYLRSIQLYDPLDLEGVGTEFEHNIFEEMSCTETKLNRE